VEWNLPTLSFILRLSGKPRQIAGHSTVFRDDFLPGTQKDAFCCGVNTGQAPNTIRDGKMAPKLDI